MSFRFRRQIKLFPGVKLNINKKSASFSIGPKGCKTTLGSKGIRNTIGIPGSGLSYTQYTSYASSPNRAITHVGNTEANYAFSLFDNLSTLELLAVNERVKSEGKSKALARLLSIFLGWLGAQRFYVGDYFKGLIYFATGGFFGLGWIYDIFTIGNRINKVNNEIAIKAAQEIILLKNSSHF